MEEPTDTSDSIDTGDTTSDAGSDTPSYVTPDQLQDFGKNMMGEFRKVMAGMMKTQAPPPKASQQPAKTSNEPTPQVDLQGVMRREREVSKLIHRHGFSEEQEDTVRNLIDTVQPEDVGEFVKDFATKFGVSKAKPSEEPMTQANPNPTSDGGSPGMTPSEDSDDSPAWKWSEDKMERLIRKKGYRGFAQEVEKNLQSHLRGKRFATSKR